MSIVWIIIALAALIMCGCLIINVCHAIEKNEELDINKLFEWPANKN